MKCCARNDMYIQTTLKFQGTSISIESLIAFDVRSAHRIRRKIITTIWNHKLNRIKSLEIKLNGKRSPAQLLLVSPLRIYWILYISRFHWIQCLALWFISSLPLLIHVRCVSVCGAFTPPDFSCLDFSVRVWISICSMCLCMCNTQSMMSIHIITLGLLCTCVQENGCIWCQQFMWP